MKFLLAVACLVAVCSAIPPVPMVPHTFCATGEVEFHEGGPDGTAIGKFRLCRDQLKQMEALTSDEFTGDPNRFVESLLRYDMKPMHMAYYIRSGKDPMKHCAPMMVNATTSLPPFFDWVKLANYEGQPKIRERFYDLWGLSVADTRFELYVDINNANMPYFFNRYEPETFIKYSFLVFNVTTPAESEFIVPKDCSMP